MSKHAKNSSPGQRPQEISSEHLSHVVHDLNNLLYALVGFMEIAMDDLPPGHSSHEALVEAVRASDGVAAIVNALIPDQAAPASKKPAVNKIVHKPKVSIARRVLVIEEDAMVAELMERALKRFGFEPQVFVDARQAFAVFSETPDYFDAIITDEASPHAAGYEVVMKMRSARPQLPIILMTSGSESMMTSRALEAGIEHVMHKPVKIQELCRTLEELTLTIIA